MDVPCIYVEGDSKDSDEGHAWDIVGDRWTVLLCGCDKCDSRDFCREMLYSLLEHKTIIYDYLCPFPEEYEKIYTASDEFPLPACTATDCNFYVLNQACFNTYDAQEFYNFCCMRLDNGAAVVRLKYTSEEAFDAACRHYIQEEKIRMWQDIT